MLPNFKITNYRTFSHLQIERLRRVNLIVGKNNVGKTTLLEALHVYAAENPRVALETLADHDELLLSGRAAHVYLDYGSLVHGRQPTGAKIVIGPMNGISTEDELTLELVNFEGVEDSEGKIDFEEITNADVEPEGEIFYGLGIRRGGGPSRLYPPRKPRWEYPTESGVVYIRTEEVPSGMLGRWWDSIAGTAYEREVIDSLSIVAPLELIRLINDPTRDPGRLFSVRMQGETEPVPLKSLGGGPLRMFQIATAVAYLARMSSSHRESVQATSPDASRDGLERRTEYLLIDEIENGIHYTLHVKLWRFIFRLAIKYDLQVFATSHSWDCMKAFAKALAEDETNDGLVIRLEEVEGKEETGAVIIDREDLPIVIRDSIEVR